MLTLKYFLIRAVVLRTLPPQPQAAAPSSRHPPRQPRARGATGQELRGGLRPPARAPLAFPSESLPPGAIPSRRPSCRSSPPASHRPPPRGKAAAERDRNGGSTVRPGGNAPQPRAAGAGNRRPARLARPQPQGAGAAAETPPLDAPSHGPASPHLPAC